MKVQNGQIKAVVSDFDGTIIKEGQTAPPESFFGTVNALLAKGIPFVAASGRQYANLTRILSPIADKIDFIAENGCLVRYQGEVIYKAQMERSLCMELLTDLKQEPGTELMVSGENTSYIVTENMEFVNMLRDKIKSNVTVLKDYEQIPEAIIKFPSGGKAAFRRGKRQSIKRSMRTGSR